MSPAVKALTRSGRPRQPTIYEVAERAGVSIATVSRVQRKTSPVATPTRARVERAIEELSYRPSRLGRSLAAGSHDATGIVFPDLSGPYYSAVILGYEEASAAQGRSVLILGTHRRPNVAEQVLELADRVDGMVVMSQTVGESTVEELVRRGAPLVLLARSAPEGADSVQTENRRSAARLARHLIEHGHRRIAFVGDPRGAFDVRERWLGYLAAHRAAGLRPAHDAVPSAFREADGREAGARLLASPTRPTAVMAANDEIALGVLDAAREIGMDAPGDLAITGWDDIPMTRHVAPALTTVRQPMVELGRRAAELLHERVARERTEPRHEVLPTEVVVRSSCGCNERPSYRKEE